jgi:hypothetical protein
LTHPLFCFVLFCFVLPHWDLPNHDASCHNLGIFENLSMSRVHQLGLRLFEDTVWKLLIIKPWFPWNLNKIKTEHCMDLGVFLVLLENLWRVKFNKVYFTIFKAKVWKILIFEWILLMEIQTNCKNWFWKEKSVEPSMCSHLGQWHHLHLYI